MKKVLLIDDDPITNFVHQKLIETTGLPCQVTVALNGQQGLDLLMKKNDNGKYLPDVILLDINMPVTNGFEFLEELQQLPLWQDVSSSIAILSSSNNTEDMAMAKAMGITAYLVKPITADVLRDLLLA